MQYLRSALRQAVHWQLLLNDPTQSVQLPRQQHREMRVLTTEQARTFLKIALATPHGYIFTVALTTGECAPANTWLSVGRISIGSTEP
jgi:hypothetical protein